jgi:hypothetical protein
VTQMIPRAESYSESTRRPAGREAALKSHWQPEPQWQSSGPALTVTTVTVTVTVPAASLSTDSDSGT